MGFLAGSLTLIVMYTLLQHGSASRVDSAGKVSVSGLRRVLSGDVAGVPAKHTQKTTVPPGGGGGGPAPRPTGRAGAGGVWI